MKQPTFLWKNERGIYFFRARIPKQFTEYFTGAEIKKSLQTDSYRLAVKLARAYRVELDRQMEKLEKGTYSAFSVTLEGKITAKLPDGTEKLIEGKIQRNINPDEDTTPHKEYLARQLREEAERIEKQAREQALFDAQLSAIGTTPKSKESNLRSISLSALGDEYANDKVNMGEWEPESTNHKNGLAMLGKIVDMIGDKPTTELTELDAVKVEEEIPKLPGRYRGSTLAISAQAKYWVLFCNLIKFGKKKLYIETDITEGRKGIASTKQNRKKSEYTKFTDKELQQIFDGHIYQEKRKRHSRTIYDYQFWLPLLAIYTGARLNELCQLQTIDIKHCEDIWYVDITDQDEEGEKVDDKSVKSDAGKRKVPIHSKLIELGFLDFVQQKRDGNLQHMIFTTGLSYNESSGKWGRNAGDWFNGGGKKGYKDDCGIPNNGKKVFHSFRKSFASNMINHTSADRLAQLIGHEQEYKTTFIYAGEIALPALKIDIEKLDYKIDLSHVSYDIFKAKK